MMKATLKDAFKTVSDSINGNITPARQQKKEKSSRLTRVLMEYSDEEDDAKRKFFGTWCMDDCLTPGRASSATAPTSVTSVARSNDISSDLSSPVESPCRKMERHISQLGECNLYKTEGSGKLLDPNNVQGPPEINRGISVAELHYLDEFPLPSWQGDFFLDFNMKMNLNGNDADEDDDNSDNYVSPPKSYVDSMSSFQTAWSMDDDGYETVVTSNRSGRDRSIVSSHLKRTIGRDTNESLREIFHIKMYTPLKLPKQTRKKRFKQFIRPLKQSDRSIDAAEIMQDSNIDTFWVRNASFNEAQENILLGVPLKIEKKNYGSPQRIGAMLKRSSSVVGRDANPARKLESILKKSQWRTNSDSVQRIRQSLSRKKGPRIEIPQRDKKCKLDKAFVGIFDGLDVISCGSARKVSYIGQKQKKLVGQRYTLRSMVLDSLWSESGRDPAEIKFEGFSQRGEGDDRWCCRIERSNYQRSQQQANIWGKGNNPPPSYETKLNETHCNLKSPASEVSGPKNTFAVLTLEQLKVAHECAIAPLKVC